ncbi:hypothetical protein [Streptomyces sp. NPDC015131]|uniref:hypothetical protein n=1 Tax=Streptomyces sp. NPDC015131 TaxID=3364941 RepID=UPI0036F70E19
MRVFWGGLCMAAALLPVVGAWFIARKGGGLLRQFARELGDHATARGTCLAVEPSQYRYRISTPDGETHTATVLRTGNLTEPEVGSRALLRYRKDDPREAERFAVAVVATPVMGVVLLGLALFCVVAAAGIGVIGYAVAAGDL